MPLQPMTATLSWSDGAILPVNDRSDSAPTKGAKVIPAPAKMLFWIKSLLVAMKMIGYQVYVFVVDYKWIWLKLRLNFNKEKTIDQKTTSVL
jgi:hypothetical protein